MDGQDFSTNVSDDGYYDDGRRGYGDARRGASCRREAMRVSRSATTWVYVIIFMLLLFILIFVILIYGKVKGVAVKPSALGTSSTLQKPGRVFTGTMTMGNNNENDEE